MNTNNEKGRTYVIIVIAYLVLKTLLNMLVGGGFNFGDVLFTVLAAVAMFSGLQYLNYAVAAIMALTVLSHLPANLKNLPSSILYLIEGVIDAGAVVLLVLQNDVKEHFTNKWSELSELIKK